MVEGRSTYLSKGGRLWRIWFRIRRYGGAALLWVGRVATFLILFTSLWVLSYRFINPAATPLIVYEYARLGDVDWRWRSIEQVSPDMRRSLVAAEDSRFCEHRGVELSAILAALSEWRRTGKLQGGSTITQQTAKNLFLWPGRTIFRKAIEAWFTGLMELLLPKERILELYLNVAEFDEGVFGVEAAAQRAFSRSAEELSLWRATRLAVVLPAPTRRDARDLPQDLITRADAVADGARTLQRTGRDWCFVRES